MRRKRKCWEKDGNRTGLLAPCGLKKGGCFLWQPIQCRENHRGAGRAEAERCQQTCIKADVYQGLDFAEAEPGEE